MFLSTDLSWTYEGLEKKMFFCQVVLLKSRCLSALSEGSGISILISFSCFLAQTGFGGSEPEKDLVFFCHDVGCRRK